MGNSAGTGRLLQSTVHPSGGDTVVEHGYLTSIITDKGLDWLENERDKSKPFALIIHHKAIHRDWIADTCDLDLFEDTDFPVPETFYDDYAGRPAAAARGDVDRQRSGHNI